MAEFFPDIGLENLAARELEDRRRTDQLQRRQVTPALARQVADLSHTYPNLSGAVLTGAALSGIGANSPYMMELARRDLEMSYSERAGEGLLAKIGRGIRGASRAFFLTLDAISRETLTGTASFLTGLAQGLDPGESAQRSYGFSAGANALAARLAGQEVSTGTGWFPNSRMSDLADETVRRLGEGQTFEQAIANPDQQTMGIPVAGVGEARRQREGVKIAGTEFPVTPGRLLASAIPGIAPTYEVEEPGRGPFHWISGATDFAVNIFGDPSNIALGWAGDLKKASDVLIADGLRPTVAARTGQQWLGSAHGQRVSNEFAKMTDFQAIYSILTRSQRGSNPATASLALQLRDANTPGAVSALLSDAINERRVTRVLMPQSLLGRPLGVGSVTGAIAGGFGQNIATAGGLRLSRRIHSQGGFMQRMGAEVGMKALDPTDLDSTVHGFGEFLKVARFDGDRISHYMEEMARRVDPDSPYDTSFAVIKEAMAEWSARFAAEGYGPHSIRQIERLFSDVEEYRKFWLNAAGDPQLHPTKGYQVMVNGQVRPLPGAHLMSEFLERNIPLPDIRAVRSAMRKLQRAESNVIPGHPDIEDFDKFKGNVLAASADLFMGSWWKPMTLLRVAWPVRVIAEEQVRMAASSLDSMFSHPIHWLAWSIGRRGSDDIFDDPMAIARQFRASQSRRGGHWLDPKSSRSAYKNEWLVRRRDLDEDWIDGAAIQLEQLWNDEVATAMARIGTPTGHATFDDLVTDYTSATGPLSRYRRLMVRDGHGQLDDPATARAYLESVNARLHHHTGGKFYWRDPETNRWRDMWGNNVEGRPPAVLASAPADVRYIVTSPGNPELVSAIANRRLGTIDLTALHPSDPNKFRQVINHLDSNPVLRRSLPEFSKTARRADAADVSRWDMAVDRSFTLLMSMPTNKLSRAPAFKQFYWQRISELRTSMDRATRTAIEARATAAGVKLDRLGTGFVRRSDQGAALGRLDDLEDIDNLAKAYALERTKTLLYDSSKRHNIADINRNMAPFGEAWYEILSSWTRIMTENPGVLRRVQQGMQGLRSNGFFYTDPDTGEEVFNYPGMGLLAKFMFGVSPLGVAATRGLGIENPFEAATPEGGPTAAPQFTGRVAGLNLALGQFIPGLGPIVQIPASFFTPLTTDPDFKGLRDLVMPFGPSVDDPRPGAIVDSLMPAWFKKALTSTFGDRVDGEQQRLLANTTMNVFTAMMQNGEVDTTTEEGYRLGLEKARRRARGIFLIRSAAQFAGPTGPGVRWEVRWDQENDPDGVALSYQVLATAWREMLDESGGDELATFNQFEQTFGLDPTAIVTAKSKRVIDRSVTEEGQAFQAENGDLFDRYELTAYYGAPDRPTAGFDYNAYLGQLQSGAREPLTPEQWLMNRNRLLGEIGYQAAKAKITGANGEMRTDEEARVWLRRVKDSLITAYPGFGFDTPGVGAGVSAEQMRREFATWVDEPRLMATDAGRGLGLYLRAREQAVAAAAERGITETGLATADAAAEIRAWLLSVAQWIVMNTGDEGRTNADFLALWDRAYSREVEDQGETTMMDLMGEQWPVGR